MNSLKYTITNFDKTRMVIDVAYDDGSWAKIPLFNPLPRTALELEEHIRLYAPSVEEIESKVAPDADVSYIDSLLGVERITARKRLIVPEPQQIDPAVAAKTDEWETIQFRKQIAATLFDLGVITQEQLAKVEAQ